MTIESNIEQRIAQSISIADQVDTDAAYDEGAFFADTDWPWSQKEHEHARPASMAEHLLLAWRFVSSTVRPDWNTDEHRDAFILGYEDRATELADAGEAGYQALAEAGGVADTDVWVLQSPPWPAKATDEKKALRAVRAAWAGAAAWRRRADATGDKGDRYRAEEAEIRAGLRRAVLTSGSMSYAGSALA